MRIPDYKKMATRAVNNWKRLQAQKQLEKDNIFKEDSTDKAMQTLAFNLIENSHTPN